MTSTLTTLRCKVAIVGDAGVGKTSLIKQCIERNFPNQYLMTLGANLFTKIVEVPVERESSQTPEAKVELYLIDISGSKIYDKQVKEYLDNINAFIAVYDVTKPETFNNMNKWVEMCLNTRPPPKSSEQSKRSMVGTIVGNKTDLAALQKVQPSTAQVLSKKFKIEFFQLSAIQPEEADTPFHYVAEMYYRLYQEKVGQSQLRGDGNI